MLGFAAVGELVVGEFEFVTPDVNMARIIIDMRPSIEKQISVSYYIDKIIVDDFVVNKLIATSSNILLVDNSKAKLSKSSMESV